MCDTENKIGDPEGFELRLVGKPHSGFEAGNLNHHLMIAHAIVGSEVSEESGHRASLTFVGEWKSEKN